MATRRIALILGCSLAWAATAQAQAPSADGFPNRAVRIVVPFAPGATSDIVARLLQPRMSEFLQQSVVVENRPGAAGNIAMEAVVRAEPDGHTILLGNVGTVSINPHLFTNLTINPAKDLAPLSLLAETPSIWIVNPKFAPKSVEQFVAYAKANPGKVNYGSPGSGSLNRLKMEQMRAKYQLEMTHVPFGGAAPAVNAVMAGHVETMFVTVSSAITQVQGGLLNALAVTSKERLPALPNVPTLIELKVDTDVSPSWQGMLVPAQTPPAIVDKLHKAILHAMADPEVRRKFMEAGDAPVTSASPAAFKAYIEKESAVWGKVVRDTGAKP